MEADYLSMYINVIMLQKSKHGRIPILSTFVEMIITMPMNFVCRD